MKKTNFLQLIILLVLVFAGYAMPDSDLNVVRAKIADYNTGGFDEIVFVKRDTYQSNHYYTDYINGCKYFGGNICILSLKDGSVRQLVPSMKHGIFGRFDLSFNGKKIVFGWKEKIGVGFRM